MEEHSIHATPEEVDQVQAEAIELLRQHQNFLLIVLNPEHEESIVVHTCNGAVITHMWSAVNSFQQKLAEQMLRMAVAILDETERLDGEEETS